MTANLGVEYRIYTKSGPEAPWWWRAGSEDTVEEAEERGDAMLQELPEGARLRVEKVIVTTEVVIER